MTDFLDETPTVQFRNEASIMRKYLGNLESVTNLPCRVQGIVERDSNGVPSKAWRFVLNPSGDENSLRTVAVFDLDDTLIKYTEKKEIFYNLLEQLVPEEKTEIRASLAKVFKAVNKASRVLPENGVHPEHYSPRLELMTITSILQNLQNFEEVSDLFAKITPVSKADEDEKVARQYIAKEIFPKLTGLVAIKEEVKGGLPKNYFMETVNQSLSIDSDRKPFDIDSSVWEFYNDTMMKSVAPEGEFDNFDLPNDVRFIVATFGEVGFQLEKITNLITELKNRGKRVPDELVIFVRGRKEPVIKKFINVYPNADFYYIDDSLRQVEKVSKIGGITVVRAVRAGSKRAGEEASDDIKAVDMASTPHTKIININSK